MRNALCLAVAVCLVRVTDAQEAPIKNVPHAPSRRPVSDLLGSLRDRFLPRQEVGNEATTGHKVVLRLSERLFTSFIEREIEHQGPVADVILGTVVSGQARTIAIPRVDIVPHPSQASFHVVMEGTTSTQTVGHNGPAVIHNRSITQFRALKLVRFSPEKGFHAEPAVVEATSQIVTDGVSSQRGRLINRIIQRRAWREINAKRAQTQMIVQEKAKRRVAEVMDLQVDEALATLNGRHDLRQIGLALFASGRGEPGFDCCSTENCIRIAASLGKAGPREIRLPSAEYLTSPVQLWIHRSEVSSQFPDIMPGLGGNELALSSLVSAGHFAPAAILATQIIRAAGNPASSAIQLVTVEDWLVVELGGEGTPGKERVVQR